VVAQRLLKVARPYATPGHPVMPMFELIATVAHPFPTPSGLYRTHQEDAIVRSFLKAVRRIDGMLVLDVQPGRDDFVSSPRHREPYLRQPDVGVALDPEFAMGPGQVPGKQLGRTHAAAINRASAYVAGIVRRHRLPQKLFKIHQFRDSMIADKAKITIRPRPGHDLERRQVRGPLGQAGGLPVLHPRPAIPSRPETVLRERRRPDAPPRGPDAQAGPHGDQLPVADIPLRFRIAW
jgi:hypothetical protein